MSLPPDPAPRLRAAQERAVRLFDEIGHRGLIRANVREEELSREIHGLARELFGGPTWWHRRLVRAGRNTLCPYQEHPPDRAIAADDIVFVDLGPVFEGHEADYGRTWVLGTDPHKQRIRDEVESCFDRGRAFFEAHPQITGCDLYAHMQELARERGWQFGGVHCGHLVGEFPHEKISGDKMNSYIHAGNVTPLRGHYDDGTPRHWILEVHFVDRARSFGAFYEALLTA